MFLFWVSWLYSSSPHSVFLFKSIIHHVHFFFHINFNIAFNLNIAWHFLLFLKFLSSCNRFLKNLIKGYILIKWCSFFRYFLFWINAFSKHLINVYLKEGFWMSSSSFFMISLVWVCIQVLLRSLHQRSTFSFLNKI